jgi:hypothetical protein
VTGYGKSHESFSHPHLIAENGSPEFVKRLDQSLNSGGLVRLQANRAKLCADRRDSERDASYGSAHNGRRF